MGTALPRPSTVRLRDNRRLAQGIRNGQLDELELSRDSSYHGNPRETFISRGYFTHILGFVHGFLGSKGRWFQTFFIFTPIPGEMIQFDENIFQRG